MKRQLLAINLAILLLIPLFTPVAQALSVTITAPSAVGSSATRTFTTAERVNDLSLSVPADGWYSLCIETTTSSGNLTLYDSSDGVLGFRERGVYDYRVDAYLEAGSYRVDHLAENYNQSLKYTLTASRLAVMPVTLEGKSGYSGDGREYSYVTFTPPASGYYEFSCSDDHFSGIYDDQYDRITSSKVAFLKKGSMYTLRFWNYEDYSGTVSVQKLSISGLTPGQTAVIPINYTTDTRATTHVRSFTPTRTGSYRMDMSFAYHGQSGYPYLEELGYGLALMVEDGQGNRLAEIDWPEDYEGEALYRRSLEVELTRGKTYYIVMNTRHLGVSGTLSIQARCTEPELPVNSTSEEEVLDQVVEEIDLNTLLPEISYGMDELKGPQVTVGGQTFHLFELESKVKIPLSKKLTLQLKADTEKKTINILLGYKTKDGSMTVVGDPNNPWQEDSDYWESYRDAKELYQMVTGGPTNLSAFRSKFQEQYDKMQEFEMDLIVKAKARVGGFIEFSYESGVLEFSKGGGLLTVELSKTVNGRLPSFPMAYVTLKFKASTEGRLSVVQEESGLNFEAEFDAALSAAVGVGLGKNTGLIQAYVEGGLEGKLDVKVRPMAQTALDEDPLAVSLSGSLYLKWKAIFWEDKYETKLAELGLYPTLEALSGDPLGPATMEEFWANATPMGRDYLNVITLQAAPDGYAYYDSSVYPYAEPSLMALPGGELLMVWVDDTGKKGGYDRTSILYSVYSGDSWSTPQVIRESGTYNDQPVLCQDEAGVVHLLWSRASMTWQADWTQSDLLAHMQLCHSSFQNGVWSEPTVISADNALSENAQVIAAGGGILAAAWVENSDNDLLMNSGINTVWIAVCQDGTWQPPQQVYSSTSPVSAITLSASAGGWQLTFTESIDGIENTYLVQQDESLRLLGADLRMPRQADGHLYYLLDGSLYQDGSPMGLEGLTNYQIVSSDSKSAVLTLVSTGLACELFGSYYDSVSGTWSDWTQLTNYGKYIRSYSPLLDSEGRLTAALNLVDVDTSEQTILDTAALAVAVDPQYYDLVVEDWVTYDDSAVIPGSTLSLSFQVTNNTPEALTQLSVQLSGADEAGQETSLPCSIQPGESATLSLNYTLPTELTEHSVTVSVTPLAQESDQSNNAASVTIGSADLSLTVDEPRLDGERGVVSVAIKNEGYAPAQAPVLKVYDGNSAGETVASLTLNEIAAGNSTEQTIILPEKYLFLTEPDTLYALQFELTTASEERVLSNNSQRVVFDGLMPWQASGLPNGQGNLIVSLSADSEAQDAAFVLAVYREDGRMITTRRIELSGSETQEVSVSIASADGPVTAKLFCLEEETNAPRSLCWMETFG